ncbi:MAG: hypothetical protein GQ545_00215 [Candidatus Aminicenantes bacterium]|nr:hypothetical protein [Candidatus Aminicenantes bacterium]
MDKHVKLISVLWIVYGCMGLLWAFIIFSTLIGVSFIPDISEEGIYILRGVGVFVSVIIGIFSLPEVIAGIGLLKKKEWARILAMVVSFLNLIAIPLGTALSIYTLVILFKDETAELFKAK